MDPCQIVVQCANDRPQRGAWTEEVAFNFVFAYSSFMGFGTIAASQLHADAIELFRVFSHASLSNCCSFKMHKDQVSLHGESRGGPRRRIPQRRVCATYVTPGS